MILTPIILGLGGLYIYTEIVAFLYVLAGVLVGFSTIFYGNTHFLIIGLLDGRINKDETYSLYDIGWRLTQFFGPIILLYHGGYVAYAAMWALPWMIIVTYTEIIGWLYTHDWIDIEWIDEDE